MAFRARVYLQPPGKTETKYLGMIELELRPIRNGRTRFTYGGKTQIGYVDRVTPID
jgi:hypothetical protein